MSAMKTRILYGTILIAVLVGLLWADHWMGTPRETSASLPAVGGRPPLRGLGLSLVTLGLVGVGMLEVGRLAASAGTRLLMTSGLLASAAVATLPFWWQFVSPGPPSSAEGLAVLAAGVGLIFAEQMLQRTTEQALQRVAATVLGVGYLGVGMSLILAIRVAWSVPMLVLFLGAVKFTDIGGYLVGSRIGRHKMIPWLSPGKSWEGLAGGLALGTLLAVAVKLVFAIEALAIWEAAVFGVSVGLAGQFADLCESLLKRSAGAKDSGALVPSFGGVLDLVDSPLLAAPLAVALLRWLAG
jgi:phosphatidate cytidylyltransferase